MRPWSRAVPAALALALLLAVVTATSGAAAAQTADSEMRMTVSLQPDGDAVWNVSTTVPIESETDREAFDELAVSFEQGEAGVGYSADTFRAAAAAASEATGRPMSIRDVTYETVTGEESGRLTLRFTWTNFSTTRGDRLAVGDAFNTTSGTWLPGLTAGQTLVIEPPPGYAVNSAPLGATVEEGALRWEGPTTFEPGYLSATYRQSETTPDPGLGLGPAIGGGLVALVVLAAGAYLLVRRRRGPAEGPVAAEANGGTGETEPATGESDPSAGEDVAASAPGAADEGVDEELLSDEERVERLLERNGGRMKQADIVDETGWSNAKVSQLLSTMDEADRVDKLRIGRENLISLPDEDVGDIGEPD